MDEIVKSEKVAEIAKKESFADYIRKQEITDKFALVLGKDITARRYIQSVILLYEMAEPGEFSLKNCSYSSIVKAALRAAVLRVSVDPIDREAHLIPRNNKKTEKQEACLQLHYQEIHNRAMRTGRYIVINVSPIYEGTEIYVDVYTGLHVVKFDGMEISNESARCLRKWGEDDGKKRIGWLGYYKMIGRAGTEKTIYMSIDDIEKQVHSAPGGGKGFGWTKFRETMERKTVLLALLRQADLKAIEMSAVNDALKEIDDAENDETIDVEAQEAGPEIPTEQDEEYLKACEIKTPSGNLIKNLDDKRLGDFIVSQQTSITDEMRTAAKIIRAHRVETERKAASALKDLGV